MKPHALYLAKACLHASIASRVGTKKVRDICARARHQDDKQEDSSVSTGGFGGCLNSPTVFLAKIRRVNASILNKLQTSATVKQSIIRPGQPICCRRGQKKTFPGQLHKVGIIGAIAVVVLYLIGYMAKNEDSQPIFFI